MARTGKYSLQPILPFDDEILIRGPQSLYEATSQTFLKGAPVIFSSGYIAEAGTGPSVVYGIAAEDAHNITAGSQQVKVYPVVAGDKWLVTLKQAHAVTDFGSIYGLIRDTSKVWYLDSDDSNDQMTVVGRPDGAPGGTDVGDDKMYVLATFNYANIQAF